jgi:hypothetical protein
MARKIRRSGSLWSVELMKTKAATQKAVKHAKALVLLHKMRMLAPLDGLVTEDDITLKITLAELMDHTGIRNRNDLIAMLDWLDKHGGIISERYEYPDGEWMRRSGLYWLGRVIQTKRPVDGRDGKRHLMYSRSKVNWYDLRLTD